MTYNVEYVLICHLFIFRVEVSVQVFYSPELTLSLHIIEFLRILPVCGFSFLFSLQCLL